jgi:hypothetical protein
MTVDPKDTREFECEGETWTVTRRIGVGSGASAQGWYPKTGRRGFHFSSSSGEQRFLEKALLDLPSRDVFQAMSDDELRELLGQSQTD